MVLAKAAMSPRQTTSVNMVEQGMILLFDDTSKGKR